MGFFDLFKTKNKNISQNNAEKQSVIDQVIPTDPEDELISKDGFSYDYVSMNPIEYLDPTTKATVRLVGHGQASVSSVDKAVFGAKPTIRNIKKAVDEAYTAAILSFSGRFVPDKQILGGMLFGEIVRKLQERGIEGGMFIGDIDIL